MVSKGQFGGGTAEVETVMLTNRASLCDIGCDFKWKPYTFLTWWDMLQNYCSRLSEIAEILTTLNVQNRLQYDGSNGPAIETELKARERTVEKLYPLLKDLDMQTSLNHLGRIQQWLKAVSVVSGKIPDNGMLAVCNDQFRSLSDMIKSELQSRVFYYVPGSMRDYYDRNQFSDEVINKFPQAITDMKEAGKCFALGRNTAAAFHLVRVAEHGLNVICQEYGIQSCDSWGKILQDLRGYAVDSQRKSRKSNIMALHARIVGVKDAWRDDTMHVNRLYDREEVEELFEFVKCFMSEVTKPLP